MPSLAGQQPEFLVLQMFLLREGLREVPEMKGLLTGLSDADLENLAAYFAREPLRLAHPPARPELYERGAALAQARGCGSCHLPQYTGQRQVPRLAGQREDFLASAMRAYRDDRRSGTDTSMNAAMYGVTDAEIDAIAHFLARQ
jgi:cytochrome c553